MLILCAEKLCLLVATSLLLRRRKQDQTAPGLQHTTAARHYSIFKASLRRNDISGPKSMPVRKVTTRLRLRTGLSPGRRLLKPLLLLSSKSRDEPRGYDVPRELDQMEKHRTSRSECEGAARGVWRGIWRGTLSPTEG
ncbi:hypothetical protein F5Y15DRAFT_109624 [Xylariaceae sp. FL0016]|nr:hypothetical protein F5Y15DRAFT_109624 [Xylariaceae sp. FL0016]